MSSKTNSNSESTAEQPKSSENSVESDSDDPVVESSEEDSTVKLPLILDGSFFKILKNIDDGKKISARCMKCTIPKVINGSITATSNFLTHFKRLHQQDFKLYEDQKRKLAEAKRQKNASIISLLANPPTRTGLITHYSSEKPTQSKVDELIRNYIVNSMKPLRTVEENSFIDLVTGLCPGAKVITRRRLNSTINTEAEQMKSRIIANLKAVDHLCLTADAWSAKSRSYFGVTCHWIDIKLDRQSVALACHRFKGCHSFDKIAGLLMKTFKDFDIPQDKIVCIVTDNGSNFVKAFRCFGPSDNDSDDEDADVDPFDESELYEPLDRETICLTLEDTESILTNPENGSDPFTLPKHHRCVAHTLALVASKDSDKAIGSDYKRLMRSTMAKCSSLWNSNSKPKSAEIIQTKCGKLFVTPCKTRWNSMYDSVRRLLDKDVKPHLDYICDSLNLPKLLEREVKFLEEYKKVMAPIAQGLDILQGDTFMAALLPTLFTIKSRLSSLNEDSALKHTKPLVAALKNGLLTRFKDFFDLAPSKKDFILSTISHPYFKLKWVDLEKYEYVKNLFLQEIAVMGSETVPLEKTNSAHEATNDFFVFPTQPGVTQTHDVNNRCHLECLQYLEDPGVQLDILHRYTSVRSLFLKHNTAIPSSAPVERFFSFGGLILTAKRRKMTDQTFQKLILSKCNTKTK